MLTRIGGSMLNNLVVYGIIFTPAMYITYNAYNKFKNTKTVEEMELDADRIYDEYESNIKKYVKIHPDLLQWNTNEMNKEESDEIKEDFISQFKLTKKEADIYFDMMFKNQLDILQRDEKKPKE